MKLFFRFDKSPCNKRDNVQNVIGHYQEIMPFRAKQDTSTLRRCPVCPVVDYFPIMTGVLYIIPNILLADICIFYMYRIAN